MDEKASPPLEELHVSEDIELQLHKKNYFLKYKLNSHLTCFRRGFIAQLVEHRTGIAEVMGSNPVEASDFFWPFFTNA